MLPVPAAIKEPKSGAAEPAQRPRALAQLLFSCSVSLPSPPCPGGRFGAPREPVLPPRATGLGGRRGSRQGLAYKRHLLCLVLGWPYSFGYRAAGGCTAPAGERLAEGTRKDSRGVGWGEGGAQRVPGTLGCWARCVRPSAAARALSGEFSLFLWVSLVSVSPLLLKPWSRSSAARWVQPSRVVWTVGFSGETEGGKHLRPIWERHREGTGPDPAMQGGHGHLGCSLPQPGSRRGAGSGWQCFSPNGLICTLDLAQRAPHFSYRIYPAQKHLTGSAPKATCPVAHGPRTTAPCLLSSALQPPVLHGRLVVGRVLLADTQHLDGVGTWPLCPLPTPGAAGGGGLVGRGSEAGGLPPGGWASPLQPRFGLGGELVADVGAWKAAAWC